MKQKQMPGLMFKIMTIIMSVFKIFRNIDKEIYFTGIKSGYTVLDFGCGLGFNTIPAARIVGSTGKIFALDNNKKAIEIIRGKIKKNNIKNIEVIFSDCDTSLDDNTIDIVFLHNTFPMIENKKDVLNEIRRVLKSMGKLSYISRTGAKIMVKNKMTDIDLTIYLNKEYEKTAKIITEHIT